MSRKSKFSKEEKVKIVKRYIAEGIGCTSLAREVGCNENTILRWYHTYMFYGEDAFNERPTNNVYTKEFKLEVVEYYFLQGSLTITSAKYNISEGVLLNWIKEYNEGNIKDYNPLPEVYSMKGRRTTFEERKEIVQYCLSHNKNYKETAKVYALPYSRIYTMVKAYILEGDLGLMSAKQKAEVEGPLTEVEKLKNENEKLKRELELEKLKNEMWQKKTELEKQRIQEYKKKTHIKP